MGNLRMKTNSELQISDTHIIQCQTTVLM